jgi:hypothetical protein
MPAWKMSARTLCFTLLAGLSGCGDSGPSGPGPGEPCHMQHTSIDCPADASLCYAGGRESSCGGGALCAGDGSGMTCAFRCQQDAECTAVSATAVCMQGCNAKILNGYCVEPDVRDDLLSMSCSTGSSSTAGTAGSVTDRRGPAGARPLWLDDGARAGG